MPRASRRRRLRRDRRQAKAVRRMMDQDLIQCWCGTVGKYEDMFDNDCLSEPCGGSGFIHCYCGGDFCCCHNHGEVECPGCEDCKSDEYRDDDYDMDEFYDDNAYVQ